MRLLFDRSFLHGPVSFEYFSGLTGFWTFFLIGLEEGNVLNADAGGGFLGGYTYASRVGELEREDGVKELGFVLAFDIFHDLPV